VAINHSLHKKSLSEIKYSLLIFMVPIKTIIFAHLRQ